MAILGRLFINLANLVLKNLTVRKRKKFFLNSLSLAITFLRDITTKSKPLFLPLFLMLSLKSFGSVILSPQRSPKDPNVTPPRERPALSINSFVSAAALT